MLSSKDVLEKEEDAMWRGRFVGNVGDHFFGMNKSKLVGCDVSRERIVVMDFWHSEVDGGDGTGVEKESANKENEESAGAERSDLKDEEVA